MNNPWQDINFETYEKHIKSDNVHQLQTLNQITKEQLDLYNSDVVGILGIAGGNGLEQIDLSTTTKVYGFDINKNYLEICANRFSYMKEKLTLIESDFNDKSFDLPKINLLISNLIIEYVGVNQFVNLIDRNENALDVITCTIQGKEADDFVSESEYTSDFDSLELILHKIEPNELLEAFSNINYEFIDQKEYNLPNGKKFLRLDFAKQEIYKKISINNKV
ncbi:hypothetical protein [Staphylococcus sp. AS1337]|uniref:hypothetical protein n=1 Tax=Staphylococcus sp. AS1337 TaxID=3434042 RepID=UPI003F55ABB7